MRFGKMMFMSLLGAGHVDLAQQLQERIFGELKVANLSYDDESRVGNLDAICDYSAFGLGFVDYCLHAIEESLGHDIDLGRRLGDDLLLAIKTLGVALTVRGNRLAFDEFNHPANVQKFSSVKFTFFPYKAAKYTVRLGDIVRDVPEDSQTLSLYCAGIYVLGKSARLQMLSNLLDKDPDNVEILGRMSEVGSM